MNQKNIVLVKLLIWQALASRACIVIWKNNDFISWSFSVSIINFHYLGKVMPFFSRLIPNPHLEQIILLTPKGFMKVDRTPILRIRFWAKCVICSKKLVDFMEKSFSYKKNNAFRLLVRLWKIKDLPQPYLQPKSKFF